MIRPLKALETFRMPAKRNNRIRYYLYISFKALEYNLKSYILDWRSFEEDYRFRKF